jgi:demethylmenaquinone methyltransferase / 2-methoxy-6-polyprenyl-1,4-benzoquinol methylase
VPLDEAFATPEVKRGYNRWLFSTIAPRYDLVTRVLSYGLDQRWKDRVVELASPTPGARGLDLACGTGDLALRLAGRGVAVVGVDLAVPMIRVARRKCEARRVTFVAADITRLPVADACVDLVTAGYALRNVPDLDAALVEMHRVLRPGGRVVALDFNRPASAVVRSVYLGYLEAVGSVLGWTLHRDADTYRYIPASLRRHPGAHDLLARWRAAGFDEVTWHPLLGGLMGMTSARRLSTATPPPRGVQSSVAGGDAREAVGHRSTNGSSSLSRNSST